VTDEVVEACGRKERGLLNKIFNIFVFGWLIKNLIP